MAINPFTGLPTGSQGYAVPGGSLRTWVKPQINPFTGLPTTSVAMQQAALAPPPAPSRDTLARTMRQLGPGDASRMYLGNRYYRERSSASGGRSGYSGSSGGFGSGWK